MDALFLKILNMSIAASWLILAVILLRVFLKKAPKWINVLLWAMVAVRLLCPISFESSLSLVPNAEPIPQEIFMMEPPENHESAVFDPIENPNLPSVPSVSVDTSIEQIQWKSVFATFGWMFGMGVMFVYAAISYILVKRKVKASLHLRDNTWICDDIQTPFILGAIKPRIYIPSGTNEAQLPHIIAHENAHLKRRDHWWKPLGFLVLAIHWFNPLVWVAYILLCRDIELACDEKVIRDLNKSESISYSEALLSCSVNRKTIMVCPLAFGEVGVKERVKRVLNYKKPAFWIIIVAVIACIVLSVCFLTNPKRDSFAIRITIPAGTTREMIYQEDFVYSDEEISPLGNKITISAGDGLGDTEVVLMPIEVTEENAYEPTYLTLGMPVKMDVEKGAWFKIGISMQNPTEKDIDVYVEVEGIEVRISDESTPTSSSFDATLLEIRDGYYLVEPVEGSWELSSADRIEVPIKMLDPSLEPEVGDVIEIEYSGEILETYPARIADVYGIRVAKENKLLSLNDVIMLSQKGMDLTWSDFEGFAYRETGSGLYIRVYEINELFELWIGGGDTDEQPMYISLKVNNEAEDSIDIRTENVTDFISAHREDEPTSSVSHTGGADGPSEVTIEPEIPDEFIGSVLPAEWPDNSYTEDVPKPDGGAVSSAWLVGEAGSEEELCNIVIEDMTEPEFTDWLGKIEAAGYSKIASATEPIENEGYTSHNYLYSKEEKGISVSFVDGVFNLVISKNGN